MLQLFDVLMFLLYCTQRQLKVGCTPIKRLQPNAALSWCCLRIIDITAKIAVPQPDIDKKRTT